MEKKENLLSQFLGERPILEKMIGDTENHGLIAAHKVCESGLIAR